VQEDIETADCKSVSATINRDLIRPWMDLEFGPGRKYPRLVIARPKQEDVKQLTESLAALVPLGLRVQASEVRDKLGLSEPDAGSEVLQPAPKPEQPAPAAMALQSAQPPAKPAADPHPAALIAAAMATKAVPAVGQMVASIETMLEKARDLGEFRDMLMSAYPDLPVDTLAKVMSQGIASALAAGRSDLVEESGA
jgi:phage gp29-like protein